MDRFIDDGNGNQISFNSRDGDYMQEYLGIEYAPHKCGYFCSGDCLLDPKPDGTFGKCNNRCQFKDPL